MEENRYTITALKNLQKCLNVEKNWLEVLEESGHHLDMVMAWKDQIQLYAGAYYEINLISKDDYNEYYNEANELYLKGQKIFKSWFKKRKPKSLEECK